jgi:hypothetical protein
MLNIMDAYQARLGGWDLRGLTGAAKKSGGTAGNHDHYGQAAHHFEQPAR